jgi:glutathione S-transferase
MFPVAPNPTKVRLYLAEKAAAGNEIDITQVPVNLREGEQRSPEHLARNPMGKLPVLELDDGSFLIESLAIIEYLEERFPEPPLIGRDPAERARVRALERVADLGVLYSVARIVHATNSPLGLSPNPAAADYVREMLLPAPLAELDRELSDGRPFVAGDAPTVADCTLAAALQFARFGKVETLEGHEHVARWDRAFRERPSAASVLVL